MQSRLSNHSFLPENFLQELSSLESNRFFSPCPPPHFCFNLHDLDFVYDGELDLSYINFILSFFFSVVQRNCKFFSMHEFREKENLVMRSNTQKKSKFK